MRVITRLNIGGPSIQAVTLSHRLAEFGFSTHLVHGRLGDGEGDMSYLLAGRDVQSTFVPTLQRALAPADDVRALSTLYRILCQTRPALVHTHMAKAGALGRAAALLYNRTHARRCPARLVHTYHGHVLEGYFGAFKTNAFLRVERALAHVTDRIVAISPRIRHELLDELHIGTPSQYAVVPLGFDLDAFVRIDASARAESRKQLALPLDAPVIATLGRLTAIKQHELFLAMAQRVAVSHPSAVFLIVGDGERRAELERETDRLGLRAHVRFLGWRRDLPTIYAATDVFVLTSRNEGTPVALIEAMAAGVPGVSTDVGGVGDVIESDALGARVPDADPAALAAAVTRLLDSPERMQIGARARGFVRARFGLDRLVHDIVALYRATLTGTGI